MRLRNGHPWWGVVVGAVLVVGIAGCGNSVEPYYAGTGGAAAGGAGSGGGMAGSNATGGSPAGTGGGATTTIGSGGSVAGPGGSVAGAGGAVMGSGGASSSPGTGGHMTGLGGGNVMTGGHSGGGGGYTALTPILLLPWMDDFEGDTVGGDIKGWIRAGDTAGKWAVAMDGGTKVLQESISTSSLSWMVGGDVAWTDQKVETKVKFSSVTSSSLADIAVRLVDLDNYYFLEFKGDGSLKIRKVIAGSTTDVFSYKTKVALVAGTSYTVGVGFQGNVVTAYLNGSAIGTMTESPASLSHGGIALGFKSGIGSYDDVKVTAP